MRYSKSDHLFFILIFQLKWIVQYHPRQRTLLTHSILQTKLNPATPWIVNYEKKKGKILDAFRYPFLFYRRLSRPNQLSRERIIITFPIGCFAKGVDQFESRLSSRAADITSDANGESLQSRFAPP